MQSAGRFPAPSTDVCYPLSGLRATVYVDWLIKWMDG